MTCFVVFLSVWLGMAMSLSAQPTKADRDAFAQTKAQAEKGDADAQLRLGDLYASGTGVARDGAKALKWHRKAAEQGLARAQYQVGLDYNNGTGLRIANPAEAVKWFYLAAGQGHVDAQLELGLCYLKGEGVRESGVEAAKWFRKAADQGVAAAQYELGKCFFEGTGVTKDITEGFKWTWQAAEQGYSLAQNRLGLCYVKGEAVPKDPVQAYKWFVLAAAQDDEYALDIRVSLAKLETSMAKEQVAEAQRLARAFKPGQKTEPGTAASSANPSVQSLDSAGAIVKTGFVTVHVEDPSSEVFADDAFVGNPPARLKLAEGKHVIEVKKAGCKVYRREVHLSAGSDLNLRVVLEKQ